MAAYFGVAETMMLKAVSFLVMLAVFAPFGAQAIEPSEVLKDPVLEARARDVGRGLRCVVCQNQSIDDSNASLAADMRMLVRARILAGDTNEQVMAYMVDRYGDFVLMDPPFKASTVVLWLGPGAMAILGIVGLVFFYRRREGEGSTVASVQTSILSHEEQNRLDRLLKDKDV